MKSITFTPELMPAIINGTKTVTRRLPRHRPDSVKDGKPCFSETGDVIEIDVWPHKVGEIGYCREPWGISKACPLTKPKETPIECVRYKASEPNADVYGWTSPWFMPEHLARVRYRIESITVAMLSDIDDADAIREGLANRAEFLERFRDINKLGQEDLAVYRIQFSVSVLRNGVWTPFPDGLCTPVTP